MLVCVPFTGLGLYGGFRGNRWLRNRISVFEKFVIPSLLNQTDRDFIVWIAWRREEFDNIFVKALYARLLRIPNFKVVFTYSGCPLFDDKYEDEVARTRLFQAIKGASPQLMDAVGDCSDIYMLIQPSDDLYDRFTVESVKKAFKADEKLEAVVFTQGFLCNYNTLETVEYNPDTIPPFAAIKFSRKTFFDPVAFLTYLGLKKDAGKYKKGIPYPSHEYLGDCLRIALFQGRGFLVGTHGENISTHFNHPFGGAKVEGILDSFGIGGVEPLVLPISFRKWVMRRLPYRWQRKLRYIFGEKIYSRFYNFIRN